MTTKTLGHVLYEADPIVLDGRTVAWLDLPRCHMDLYESKASAVAAVVREKVAAWVEPQRDFIPATGAEFAAAIRSMKI